MKVFNSATPLVAPDLVTFEVLNVLRRKQRQKLVSTLQVTDAANSIQTCFTKLMPARVLVDQALELSFELNHSIYDCAYLACALALDARLLNADVEFARKIVQTQYAHRVISLDHMEPSRNSISFS